MPQHRCTECIYYDQMFKKSVDIPDNKIIMKNVQSKITTT